MWNSYGVDLLLFGHVHAYERTNPVANYTADPTGCAPTYITIGEGSAEIPATMTLRACSGNAPTRDAAVHEPMDHLQGLSASVPLQGCKVSTGEGCRHTHNARLFRLRCIAQRTHDAPSMAGDGGNDEGLYQQYVDSTLNATWGGCITDDSGANVTVRTARSTRQGLASSLHSLYLCVMMQDYRLLKIKMV